MSYALSVLARADIFIIEAAFLDTSISTIVTDTGSTLFPCLMDFLEFFNRKTFMPHNTGLADGLH